MRRPRNDLYSDTQLGQKITENTVKDLQYMAQYVYSGASALTQ